MNIFNKVALQGLLKNRTRTIVTIIGVILSAAMITAVATFAVSLQDYMVRGAIEKNGSWHIGFPEANSAFLQEQTGDSRVEHTAAYENIGYAPLKGGKNPDKPYLFIAGFSRDTFDTLPVNLIAGRLPENSSEVLLPAHVAANGGVRLSEGDTLSLSVGTRMDGSRRLSQHDPYRSGEQEGSSRETLVSKEEKTYTVVGICTRPVFEERTAPGYTLITAADSPKGAGETESLSVFVTLKDPRQVRAYGETEGRAFLLNDDALRFMGLSDDNVFNTILYSVGAVLIALVMLGSIFLIYNSFTISLSERTRQLGILLSVGATGKQLLRSVLFEGICIGIVGIPIGILVGIPGIQFVLALTAENFGNVLYDNVPLTLSLSAPALIAAAAVSMITILISAYIPASRACSIPVMECIRQTNEVRETSASMKTSRLTERVYGLEGILAAKNFKRNKKRCRSIVLSLILSVVLFVSANSFGTTLKQAASQTRVVTDYDICLNTDDLEDRPMLELYDKLKNVRGLTRSSYQACVDYSCTVSGDQLSRHYWEIQGQEPSDGEIPLYLSIQFLDDPAYEKFARDLNLTGERPQIITAAKMADPTGQAEGVHQLQDLFTSSRASAVLLPPDEEGSLPERGETRMGGEKVISLSCAEFLPPDTPIADTEAVPEETSYYLMAIAPWSLKKELAPYGSIRVKGFTFESDSASSSTEHMQTVIDSTGISMKNHVYNVSGMLDENRNLLFIVNLFTIVFVIMISLIATVNVFNTISTNVKLRRRELAMLRSVGMSDRSFDKMMRFECALYGLRTLLLGLPAAGILSWLIFKGMTIGETNISFRFPWTSMGISVLGVFLIIFITMVYAVRRIKKENIIDALRDDMT